MDDDDISDDDDDEEDDDAELAGVPDIVFESKPKIQEAQIAFAVCVNFAKSPHAADV